jgi:NodT family efflux transporter outer membrane factor (OMF) lipoprotein
MEVPWLRIAAMVALLSLPSCAVGPNYTKPNVEVPTAFAGNAPSTRPSETAGNVQPVMQWWTTLGDAELNKLVDATVAGNLDMQIAAQRLLQSSAQVQIQNAGLLPTVNGIGGYYHINNGKTSVIGNVFSGGAAGARHDSESDLWLRGLSAKLPLDVFGGQRRLIEEAAADQQAAIENSHDVMVTVVAEVAQDYLQLRGLQKRLAIANDNLKVQEDTLELTRSLRKSGFNSELDVSRQETQVSQTRAQIAPLKTGITQTEDAIATLMGRSPESLRSELDLPAPIPPAPGLVATGVPSDLLRRRPDIRRAEQDVRSANAQVGVAIADYFPKFSLTGDFGFDSSNFKEWFDWESRYFIINPGISWRVLDFGATQGKINEAEAAKTQALLTYQNTVLTALREVEDALAAYANEQDHREALAQAVTSAKESVEISHEQYKQGLIDFLQVLDTQRQMLLAEDELAQSEAAISSDLVQLYRALGGGWDVPEAQYAMK